MKVIIDFVPNHVARDYRSHLPGVHSLGADDDTSVHWSPENDFFYYPGEPLRLPEPFNGPGYFEYPAKASGNCFSPAPGINDWYETIKINYCDFHTRTWDKMYNIVHYWALKGVDGFRCDMVELVPPAFMQWLIAKIKLEFPHIVFIAEVYEKEKYRMYVEEVGFDLLYDKSGLYDTVRAVTCDGLTARALTWNWQFLGDLQPRMLNFLENHDEQRVASDFFAGSAEAGYAALGVSLLLNTAPFMLYFGEEVGERGMDDEPFSGVNGRTSIFDWWTVRSLQALRQYISDGRKGLNTKQKSILKRYREALSLARRPAFKEGKTFDLGYCQGDEDLYRSLLQDYLQCAEERADGLVRYYDERDLKAYAILAHTVKSSSKTIGASALSDIAAKLEAAADAGDLAAHQGDHQRLLEEYSATVAAIRSIVPLPEQKHDDEEIMEFLPE
jgi:glycosidase